MRGTKFIILTSLQSSNLSFPLLFHVISIATLKFLPWFPASPLWFHTFFVFPPRFPAFPGWFSAPAFPYHFSHSLTYSLHFPHSVLHFPILFFTDSLLSLCSLRIYFRKIVALIQKQNTPLFYYCITLGAKLLFTSSMTSWVLSPKIIYFIVPQVKSL